MSKASNRSLFFYQGDKLITVKQGDQHRAIFRSAKLPLAEQQVQSEAGARLLATDEKSSVLSVHNDKQDHAFTAYGHDPIQQNSHLLIGFNGEHFYAASTSYHLGNGYRAYSPALMRFRSADHWSPFGRGGLNSYTYCSGDPINFSDPSGHAPPLIKSTSRLPGASSQTATETSLMKNRVLRRFDVEHRETLEAGRLEEVNEASYRLVPFTRSTLRTTEIFEVLVDPYKSLETTYVTRTSLDQYLEISNTLHAAESVNALGNPSIAFSSAYINNLENRRQGLTLYGRLLAKRAADPRDPTADSKDTFRVSGDASELRSN